MEHLSITQSGTFEIKTEKVLASFHKDYVKRIICLFGSVGVYLII